MIYLGKLDTIKFCDEYLIVDGRQFEEDIKPNLRELTTDELMIKDIIE